MYKILFLLVFVHNSYGENLSNQDMQNIQAIRARAEQERIEQDFKNPIKVELSKDRAYMGPASAPVTIVEYSDFQCPYCGKGAETMREVRQKYGSRVRVLFKHFPLSFHPMAMPAALRYEALAMQDKKFAFAFHDEVFRNQGELKSGGENYLDQIAKKTGANIEKMKKDMSSDKVRMLVQKDQSEGTQIGVQGTPAFLVEGVRLFGAYPKEMFFLVIDRHLKEKK